MRRGRRSRPTSTSRPDYLSVRRVEGEPGRADASRSSETCSGLILVSQEKLRYIPPVEGSKSASHGFVKSE